LSNAVYAAADALREAIMNLLSPGDRRQRVLAALDALVMDTYPDLYVTVDLAALKG